MRDLIYRDGSENHGTMNNSVPNSYEFKVYFSYLTSLLLWISNIHKYI